MEISTPIKIWDESNWGKTVISSSRWNEICNGRSILNVEKMMYLFSHQGYFEHLSTCAKDNENLRWKHPDNWKNGVIVSYRRLLCIQVLVWIKSFCQRAFDYSSVCMDEWTNDSRNSFGNLTFSHTQSLEFQVEERKQNAFEVP